MRIHLKLTGLLLLVMAILLILTGVTGVSSANATVGQATAEATEDATAERTDAKGVTQVWVPAGCFTMGADDVEAIWEKLKAPGWVRASFGYEDPAREVCLTDGYWIDKTEVTNADYQKFVDDGGYANDAYWSEKGKAWRDKQDIADLPEKCGEAADDLPRVCVTWYEAEAYAKWRGGQLPTEAQWEYAARGPESLMYPWGNEWDASKANVVGSKALMPVGSYPDGASWVGAVDMSGNAMEWVQDWISKTYPKEKIRDNPTGPETGVQKAEKGGWWGSNAFVARASYKHFEDPPSYQDHHIGFRVVTPGDGEAVATAQP